MSTIIPQMDMAAYFHGSVDRFKAMRAPLYAALAAGVAEDAELCAMAALAQPGQPPDHLLFSAAELVLTENPGDPLADYFPSLAVSAKSPDAAFANFRAFCLAYRAAIEALICTRTVQTTFLNRAGLIAPAARVIADRVGEPLSLIEIGCSAGLLTLFDHYQYDFGADGRFGDASRPLVAAPNFVGAGRPKPGPPPRVGARVGLDLNPVDVSDPFERRWIEALAPPDWKAQRAQLAAALEYRAKTSLRTIAGDAMLALPALLEEMPAPLVVMHSYCLYQWPAAAQIALHACLLQASAQRAIYRLGVDIITGWRPAELGAFDPASPRMFDIFLTTYAQGAAVTEVLGRCDPWGDSAEWLA